MRGRLLAQLHIRSSCVCLSVFRKDCCLFHEIVLMMVMAMTMTMTTMIINDDDGGGVGGGGSTYVLYEIIAYNTVVFAFNVS